ncbi:hypothetical protein KAW44_02170 [Candidatus Bipolaricaulota bacterium]|nr:hypothetical protein [Candidatus Bipolaricaulota bacterium]
MTHPIAEGRGGSKERPAIFDSGSSGGIAGGPAGVAARVLAPRPRLSAGNAKTLEEEEKRELTKLRMQSTNVGVT